MREPKQRAAVRPRRGAKVAPPAEPAEGDEPGEPDPEPQFSVVNGLVVVESSVVHAVGYALSPGRETGDLVVVFKTGRMYRYHEVPPAVYAELLHAESKGSYHGKSIRGKFEYEPLEATVRLVLSP